MVAAHLSVMTVLSTVKRFRANSQLSTLLLIRYAKILLAVSTLNWCLTSDFTRKGASTTRSSSEWGSA